jgi:hypothetical protein
MDAATNKTIACERRPQSAGLARRLLHKFVRARKECPDNRSTLGLHVRIESGRMPACVRLVCGDAWPFGGRICVRHRQ